MPITFQGDPSANELVLDFDYNTASAGATGGNGGITVQGGVGRGGVRGSGGGGGGGGTNGVGSGAGGKGGDGFVRIVVTF